MTNLKAVCNWTKDTYLITTDFQKLDIPAIHAYLTRSSWAPGIDEQTVRAGAENSLNFGLFDDGAAGEAVAADAQRQPTGDNRPRCARIAAAETAASGQAGLCLPLPFLF